MPDPPGLSPDFLKTVQGILRRRVPEYEVRAFGSRVTGTAKEFSDLDLAIMTDKPLDSSRVLDLREDFTESDLPFKVDLVDWAAMSVNFREIVERKYIVIQPETPEKLK